MNLGVLRPILARRIGILILICCMPARADVMDISSEGAVTVHNSAAAFNAQRKMVVGYKATSPGSTQLHDVIKAAADRYVVDSDLLLAVARQESGFNPTAVSAKGAVGIMQLMPQTAWSLGIDRNDTEQNVLGGAAYLRQMLDRYSGNASLALAAYNAGPAAVDRFGAVPPFAETQAYVRNILGRVKPAITPPVFVINP